MADDSLSMPAARPAWMTWLAAVLTAAGTLALAGPWLAGVLVPMTGAAMAHALEGLLAALAGGVAAAAIGGAMRRGNRDGMFAAQVRDSSNAVTLARAQLDGTLAAASQSAQLLVERLLAIHGASDRQKERLLVTEACSQELDQVLRDKLMVDDQLGAILQMFVQEQEASSRENVERLNRLQGIKDLQPMVDSIQQVSRHTNILAINAAIEAARAGEAGRGFAVVAGEVRALSGRTSALATDISQRIQAATHGIDQALAQAAEAADRTSSAGTMRKVVDDLAAMRTRFADTLGRLQLHQLVEQLRSSQDDVALRLADALGQVQIEDVTRQRVQGVQRALGELGTHLDAVALRSEHPDRNAPALEPISARLERLSDQYVMESERSVLATVVDGRPQQASRDAPLIELF